LAFPSLEWRCIPDSRKNIFQKAGVFVKIFLSPELFKNKNNLQPTACIHEKIGNEVEVNQIRQQQKKRAKYGRYLTDSRNGKGFNAPPSSCSRFHP
jgi:hypothetical protein